MTAKSRGRWVWIGLVLLSLLAGALSSGGGAAAQTLSPAERVDAGLLNALAEGSRSDFIIEMSEQADLSAAYGMTDWDARGQYVVDTLKATAARSQAPVAAALQKRGADFISFFAGNVIYVRNGDQKMLEAALSQKGVGRVRAPVTATIMPYSARLEALGPELQGLESIFGETWGLLDTRAPEFWDLFGQGEGILVANIDTGVDYDHPLLLPNFRCQDDPTDPACFLDPLDQCAGDLPCSLYPHGTETMGILVALDHPEISYTVGMAPGAEWIACLGCEADRSCPELKLLACGEWILHPDDNPANRPHVVNNSWGSKDTNTWYRLTVDAWAAAGIFPVFSAGNDGYIDGSCDTIGSPADYFNSFAVGAHQENRAIWGGSSKGPGGLGTYTKPNLSAPGVSIVSTVPTDVNEPSTFVSGGLLGTSFAAPHVAGAVALLWSYYPDLHGNVGATVTWLQSRADTPPDGDCGAPINSDGNYTYGYGYLNVLGTDDTNLGAVKGTVTDDFNGLPLADATISADNGAGGIYQATTDSTGFYTLLAPEGTYQLTAVKTGYLPEEAVDVITIELRKPAKTIDFVLAGERVWVPLISK